MHGPVRDKLEELLQADSGQVGLTEHLAACGECSSELTGMRLHAAQLTSLRAAEVSEPTAGFYARVLQRIEECEVDSFWSFFLDTTMNRRLAVASLTIALALGGYVALQQNSGRGMATSSLVALNAGVHYDAPVMGTPAQQRDAVLENFAEHHLVDEQGQIR